jgi:hypothetical protein
MATRGKLRDATVVPRDTASDIGRNWVAINKFPMISRTSKLLWG